jgi:rhomboid protease GluP
VVERLHGRLVVLASLSLGVMAGGATWLVASELDFAAEPDYTVGCSAGICALVGMMLVYGYRHRRSMQATRAHTLKAQATLGIAVMLLIGLTIPNLNNVAHAGGLACGALIACSLPRSVAGRASSAGRWMTPALWGVLLISALSVVFAVQNVVVRLLATS